MHLIKAIKANRSWIEKVEDALLATNKAKDLPVDGDQVRNRMQEFMNVIKPKKFI